MPMAKTEHGVSHTLESQRLSQVSRGAGKPVIIRDLESSGPA